MKTSKTDLGEKLLQWYTLNGRDLPFRNTRDPYKIWICEIIFQQTRITQGLLHYQNFIRRFPDIASLAHAETDEVLLYWKGLGYYSRALNLHKAAQQVIQNFNGIFPQKYEDILKLPGVGKYTAAAISSICFDGNYPAIDGNFYRVLTRLFADDFDISSSRAFSYFSELAKTLIPEGKAGDLNQAMMDLGSEVCTPKNPKCSICPFNKDCLAYEFQKVASFPVKLKKPKVVNEELQYYFVQYKGCFLIHRRGTTSIWKKLYEFPTEIPDVWKTQITISTTIFHKLTHKNLKINFFHLQIKNKEKLNLFLKNSDFMLVTKDQAKEKSFPKPLENYLKTLDKANGF